MPSNPIKSEALREECVNPVWRAALPTQSVDVASHHPCSYFLAECENIATDWCSLEPTAEALPSTLRDSGLLPLSLQPVKHLSVCPWVLADYRVLLISAMDMRVVVTKKVFTSLLNSPNPPHH